MSNYECYCAICSCPLASSSITIGRPSEPCSSGSQTYSTSNDDSDSDVDEAYEYDPSIVKKTELGWLNEFRCIGFNENYADLGTAFVSGPSRYLDDEEVVATQSAGKSSFRQLRRLSSLNCFLDPNAPEDTNFSCYRDDSFNGLSRVFPIHDACFSILTQALTGSTDSSLLKKDILYEVMECLVSSNSALDVDYGGIAGPEQFWVSAKGEEYVVANPVERKPTFEEAIRRHLTRIVVPSPNDYSICDLRDHDCAEGVNAKETSITGAHPERNIERLVWIQNWDELNGASATVEAVWNIDGILIGLGMILRRKRSFAGKTEDQVMDSERESCRISTRPWIKGMIAHMDQAGAGVRGLTFMGCDNYSHTALGNTDSSLHRFALVPETGCGIVGLTLQLAAGGEILGLRAIQSPKTDDDQIMDRETDECPSYPPRFWSCRTGRLEIADSETAPTHAVPKEIQSMRLIPLTDKMENDEEQLATDLLPHEILLWNQDQIEGAALRAVSFYTPKAETGNERIIRGLRANFARGHSTRKRLVGDFEFGQWGAPLDLWPEEDLVTLKVDGSNRESISQVAISPVIHPKAIKVKRHRHHLDV
ncbi:hypothetical protein NW762_010243 [Fusarium torreyae]|uniref:Uncharacterized protein n=1 Tax=Fusarium torreyae TaxID=1237075 RepID=A0A9W8RTI7_9HYPO|nr:hypothetical protein NW762_010243 [Fusarium torreyae]